MSFSSMSQLLRELQWNQSLANLYFEYFHRRSPASVWKGCDDDCKRKRVSDIIMTDPLPPTTTTSTTTPL